MTQAQTRTHTEYINKSYKFTLRGKYSRKPNIIAKTNCY